MSDDSELLRRYAQDGSEEAFAEVVRRHVDLIYAAALRQVRDPHRAEDVVQTVFADLARKGDMLARRPVLLNWLYTSTHYAAAKMRRSEERRQRREEEAHRMHNQLNESDCNVAWEQLRPVIDQAMSDLDESTRTAVLLRFFKGFSFSAIGGELCVSEEAARKRVDRAIEKLRGKLSRYGITSTSAALALVLDNQPLMAAPEGFAVSLPNALLVGIGTGKALPTAATLTIMATTKTTFVITGAALLLAAGAIFEQQATTRAAVLAADNDLVKLQNRLTVEINQSANAEKDRARLGKIAAGLREGARNAAINGQNTVGLNGTGPDLKTLMKNPALESAALASYRAGLRPWFAELYRQLGLTPEQIERFEDILTNRAQADFDVGASALIQGISWSDPALKSLYGNNESDQAAELREIISPQQLSDYEQGQLARAVAHQLSTALNHTDTPLTPQQSASLIQLVTAHANGKNGTIDWNSVTADATALLSTAQASMLGSVQARIQSTSQIQQAILDINDGSP